MNNQDKNKPTQEQPIEEKVTITPTMIDESEEHVEKKRDLSAIIPSFEDLSNDKSSVELISQEKALKGDGTIIIGLIDSEGEANLTQNAKVPEQIDVEERKKEKQRGATKKVKKVKKKSKAAQKIQNTTALMSLITIIF